MEKFIKVAEFSILRPNDEKTILEALKALGFEICLVDLHGGVTHYILMKKSE